MKKLIDDIGVIVIGRNEGERLKRCLQRVISQIDKIVYVDSGSSDGSVEYAESIGVDIIRLDMKIPFCAGRARNEGFQLLNKKYHKLKYFQFIDGDCEVFEGWLSFAYNYLEKYKSCAVVAGRRKEKYPEKSIYNKLCDIEWNTPIGEAKACGGDFMIRKEAFLQVEGFNPVVLVSEEPELCYRLRNRNWSIYRLDHLMTFHDAAIMRFSQWWKRNLRMGHGGAQIVSLGLSAYGGKSYFLRGIASMWFWAIIFPVSVLMFALIINISFLLLFTAYLVQLVRIATHVYKRIEDVKLSVICSFFSIIGKWPQLQGQLLFLKRKLFGQAYTIVEYS
ncbi:glycosyltransferase [Thermodesulfobacteriota bacterium]